MGMLGVNTRSARPGPSAPDAAVPAGRGDAGGLPVAAEQAGQLARFDPKWADTTMGALGGSQQQYAPRGGQHGRSAPSRLGAGH